MLLLDTNILIYAASPEHTELRAWALSQVPFISAISKVEALGYDKLTQHERAALEDIFASADLLPVDAQVIDRAVALRQEKMMSLGDAIIAATALVHGLALATNNVKDFQHIHAMRVINPLQESR